MKINHHPSPECLISCSAGSMPQAFAAVMASHLEMCAACREELALLEDVGTALLEMLPPEAITGPVPRASAPEALSSEGRGSMTYSASPVRDVPRPLASTVGSDFGALQWKRAGAGVLQYSIALGTDDGCDLRLVSVAPGSTFPQSPQPGFSLMIVLQGACRDSHARYQPGDVVDLSDQRELSPVWSTDQSCIALIATVAG